MLGAGGLEDVLKEKAKTEGPILSGSDELFPVPSAVPAIPVPGAPTISILTAPVKLAKHLAIMRSQTESSVNVSEAKRVVEGFSFNHYDECAVAVRYIGVLLIDKDYPEDDPKRMPFVKIVTDLCKSYDLPDDARDNMLNAELAEESHQVNYDFKFTRGQPGNFYFGKFMAVNTKKKIDMILLFYNLTFRLSPDTIVHTIAHKFLWFTTHHTTRTEEKEIALTEKDIEHFKLFFRLRMYEELNDQIKAFALEDEDVSNV